MCQTVWFFIFNFLLRKSIQLLNFMLFMRVCASPVCVMLSAVQVRLLLPKEVFSTSHPFHCGKEQGVSAIVPVVLMAHVSLGKKFYPSPKYFSTVVRSVVLASCLKKFPISVMVLVLQKGELLCPLPDLYSKLWPWWDERGWFFVDCCREMSCQSFILTPWDKIVGGCLQTTLCLPKEIILHRMFSCLLEEGGETAKVQNGNLILAKLKYWKATPERLIWDKCWYGSVMFLRRQPWAVRKQTPLYFLSNILNYTWLLSFSAFLSFQYLMSVLFVLCFSPIWLIDFSLHGPSHCSGLNIAFKPLLFCFVAKPHLRFTNNNKLKYKQSKGKC